MLIPSWPLIVGLAAFGRALAQSAALLNDPDTYLHIAAGRWIWAHLALPTEDPFSHSFAGATWVPHEWLAEVVLAAAYWATGWGGLVVLAAACFGATIAILTRFLLRHFEPFSALIAANPRRHPGSRPSPRQTPHPRAAAVGDLVRRVD